MRGTIFLSAGEPSGDLHGSALAREIRRRWPQARLVGLGGKGMAAEGVELLAGLSELAVMGFAEVVRHLPFLLRLQRRAVHSLRGADLFIPIDYPGLNLRLARAARKRGVSVLYYIAPQVWAWHRSRAARLARDTDLVACALPFEEPFLRAAGVDARFVGHPLLDLASPAASREEWCAENRLDPGRPLLALLPGSRGQEVSRHLQLFTEAAKLLVNSGVQPVVASSPALGEAVYRGVEFPRVQGSRGLLAHARAALVKSGTSTLEAALAVVPMVVAYRMHPLSHALARRLVEVPHIALANLVAGDRVVPELVQDEATPEALAAALLPLLAEGSDTRQAQLNGLAGVRERLGGPGAAERVTELAAELLAAR
ncbi:MAG: lipid-A-disaccharide synthase [Longimicrobiaceae bacterium]